MADAAFNRHEPRQPSCLREGFFVFLGAGLPKLPAGICSTGCQPWRARPMAIT